MSGEGTLWGGGFEEPPDRTLWRFTVDPADRRLLEYDVLGSLAHVKMLARVGLVLGEEAGRLSSGLRQILEEARAGSFEFSDSDEDVHTAVERRLGELVGEETAGRLHTGRSRNDQVALDLRLYLRRAARERAAQLAGFALLLADRAEEAGQAVVASYTHLQQAQAIPFGHHLLAHAWALLRDAERFRDAERRIAVSPLGAAAGGGSGLPLEPEAVAAELDLADVFENSLDAVAARDFAAEFVFCAAQAMVDLSRLAEEMVLWATREFGWATFSDAYTTGSSALPQKKNPDVAELARGRAAGTIGDLVGILAVQKGLPLAYNRDLQEDKPAVFRADDALGGALEALGGMVGSARFHPPGPSSWVTALDLAEALVGRGVPFRRAHGLVGRLVARLAGEGRPLTDLTVEEVVGLHPAFRPDDLDLLDPEESVARRRTRGGGSFESVRRQIALVRERAARFGA